MRKPGDRRAHIIHLTHRVKRKPINHSPFVILESGRRTEPEIKNIQINIISIYGFIPELTTVNIFYIFSFLRNEALPINPSPHTYTEYTLFIPLPFIDRTIIMNLIQLFLDMYMCVYPYTMYIDVLCFKIYIFYCIQHILCIFLTSCTTFWSSILAEAYMSVCFIHTNI